MDLESTNTENILIGGIAASLTTIVEDRGQNDTQEFNKEASFQLEQKRTEFTKKRSLKEKAVTKKLEKTKGQSYNMCKICGRTFRKMSKQKIHMMTHTEMFKNLSIDKNIIWSEDRTKVTCMDCAREFQGRDKNGHMKTHIALVHYQLHNQDNLDTFNISTLKETEGFILKKSPT